MLAGKENGNVRCPTTTLSFLNEKMRKRINSLKPCHREALLEDIESAVESRIVVFEREEGRDKCSPSLKRTLLIIITLPAIIFLWCIGWSCYWIGQQSSQSSGGKDGTLYMEVRK